MLHPSADHLPACPVFSGLLSSVLSRFLLVSPSSTPPKTTNSCVSFSRVPTYTFCPRSKIMSVLFIFVRKQKTERGREKMVLIEGTIDGWKWGVVVNRIHYFNPLIHPGSDRRITAENIKEGNYDNTQQYTALNSITLFGTFQFSFINWIKRKDVL